MLYNVHFDCVYNSHISFASPTILPTDKVSSKIVLHLHATEVCVCFHNSNRSHGSVSGREGEKKNQKR